MYVPHDLIDFMQRWREKARAYRYDRLEECFDGFFTTYVLYNFLYDLICDYDPDHYPHKGDKRRATEVVLQFLGAKVIARNPVIRRSATAIGDMILNSDRFVIRDTVWDRSRLDGLKSVDENARAASILEILYQIRCNTFHGQKAFREEQRQFLIPCIEAVQTLNDMLMEQIRSGRDAAPTAADSNTV
jgi:hypothetical protein